MHIRYHVSVLSIAICLGPWGFTMAVPQQEIQVTEKITRDREYYLFMARTMPDEWLNDAFLAQTAQEKSVFSVLLNEVVYNVALGLWNRFPDQGQQGIADCLAGVKPYIQARVRERLVQMEVAWCQAEQQMKEAAIGLLKLKGGSTVGE